MSRRFTRLGLVKPDGALYQHRAEHETGTAKQATEPTGAASRFTLTIRTASHRHTVLLLLSNAHARLS